MPTFRNRDLGLPVSRLFVLLVLGALCWASPLGAQGTVVTALAVRNRLDYRRVDAPVSWGIPLSPSDEVVTLGRLRLEHDGQAVPAQFTALARWAGTPSDTTRPTAWLLVDTRLTLAALETATLRLVKDIPPVPATTLVIARDDSDGIVIETGAARYEISRRAFRLFDLVRLADGTTFSGAGGVRYNNQSTANAATLSIEHAGSERVSLLVRGTVAAGLAFTARLHLFRGLSESRIDFRLENANAPGYDGQPQANDYGSPQSIAFDDLSLVFPALAARSYEMPIGELGVGGTRTGTFESMVRIVQESSGEPRWDALRGTPYRLQGAVAKRASTLTVDELTSDGPMQVAGWIDASGVSVAVERAWQNYPKAWRARAGSVEAGLFPGEFARDHQLRAGEYKTHTVWVRHHAPDQPDISTRARSFLAPLRLVPPAAWSATRAALDYSAPRLDADFPDYERGTTYQLEISPEWRAGEYEATDIFDALSRSQCYGWVDAGDVPTDFENLRSPYNVKYNAVAGLLQQAYRSDDERWWDLAGSASRHAADIDIQHSALRGPDAPRRWFEGGMYGHGYHDENGERNPHRNYMNPSTSMAGPAPGLFLWAFASGDTLVLDSARELADNLYWKTTRTNYGDVSALARTIARETGLQQCDDVQIPCDGWEAANGSRTGAHLIKAMRHAWLATGDTRYLDLVTSLSAYLRRLEQTTGPSCDRFSFQTTFIAGLGQHLLWRRDAGLPADEPSRQLLSQRIDYMVNTLWNPATSQFRMCYDSPELSPIRDNWLLTVADAFAAGALVLDRPELVDTYARPLFEYGAANQFYAGSFVAYHSTKEYVNQVGFGHLFLYAWWRLHATPVITWATPAAITYGTALGDAQLNATTTVPGVFVYSPRAGTMLAVGTHTLSVTFTPTDGATSPTVTKAVTIDVTNGAGAPTFTDDPLVVGTTTAKAVHMTELRQAIATLRTRAELPPVIWTETSLVAGSTLTKAVHLMELRTALDAVYAVAEQTAPTYTHVLITGGVTVIAAVDIAELRTAILAVW